jgi:hypothetical protein
MDKEERNKNFSHQDERLKINTSFEEAIKILVESKEDKKKKTVSTTNTNGLIKN